MAWGEQKTSRANMSILLVETDDFFNHEEDEFSRMGSGFAGDFPCRYDPELSRINHGEHNRKGGAFETE